MGRRRARNRGHGGAPRGSRAGTAQADPEQAIRTHLAGGRTKQALQAANAWRKATPGREADALYLEVAEARVAHLGASGQFSAAEQLITSVRERFPGALQEADLLSLRAELRAGQPGAALVELVRVDLDPNRRQAILDLLAEEVTDPACVAACDAVPDDHPLRREARAAAEALEAATSGTSDLATLARETNVPRSSPFAPWKLLALGVEAAYQGDVDTVERIARQLPPRARPARLLPALKALAGGSAPESPTPAMSRLLARIQRGSASAAGDLEQLDDALRRGRARLATGLAQQLGRWFRTQAPGLRAEYERLVHMAWAEAEDDLREFAFRALVQAEETWQRHQALAGEAAGDLAFAIASWNGYLSSAVSHLSPLQVSLVRLRQADLAARQEADGGVASGPCVCPECQARYGGEDEATTVEPPSAYVRMALAAHPTPDAWRTLIGFLDGVRDSREVQEAAEAWHEALPEDLEPLLHLLRAAERRGAVRKALRLLERAERLGPTHPEVREGRFRLLVEGARRRLRQGKAHLAVKDVEALEALPRAGEPSSRILTGALRWLTAWMAGSEGQQARAWDALRDTAGEAGAALALEEAATFLEPRNHEGKPSLPPVPPTLPAAEAARILALLEQTFARVQRALVGGGTWARGLVEAMKGGFEPPLDTIEPLCRWAVRQEEFRLSFLASGIGLRRGGPRRYRFLLYRAQSLSGLDGDDERFIACLTAAQVLARRVNDAALVDAANQVHLSLSARRMRGRRLSAWHALLLEDRPSLDPEAAEALLELEASAPLEKRRMRLPRARRQAPPRRKAQRTKRHTTATLFDMEFPDEEVNP